MFAIPPGNTSLIDLVEQTVAAIYGQGAVAEFGTYGPTISDTDNITRSEPVPLSEQECEASSLPPGTILSKIFVSRAGVEIPLAEDDYRWSDARGRVEIAFEDGRFDLFFKAEDGSETSLRSLPVLDENEIKLLFCSGRIGEAAVYIRDADAAGYISNLEETRIETIAENARPEMSWNLLQTLCWVYLRDLETVSYFKDGRAPGEYREESRLPDGRVKTAWQGGMNYDDANDIELLKIGLVSSEGVQPDRFPFARYADAEAEFIAKLYSGELLAEGLRNGEGDLKEIPNRQWGDLKIYSEPPRAGPKDMGRKGATVWHKLRFDRERVEALWHPLNNHVGAGENEAVKENSSAAGSKKKRDNRGLKKSPDTIAAEKSVAAIIKFRDEQGNNTLSEYTVKQFMDHVGKKPPFLNSQRSLPGLTTFKTIIRDEKRKAAKKSE